MNEHLRMVGIAVALTLAFAGDGRAQEQPATAKPVLTPLKVQVVISKYRDNGKQLVSRLPYTLSVNANDNPSNTRSSLRIGTQVPIPSTTFSQDAKAPISSYSYRDIGTNIDCTARSADSSRYRLEITIDDSAVATEGVNASGPASFKSFRSTNAMVLRDGQSAEYTTASDKISGEVVRVEVTLTVLK